MAINGVLSEHLYCVNAQPSCDVGENLTLAHNTLTWYRHTLTHCVTTSGVAPLCAGRKAYGPHESSDVFNLHGAGWREPPDRRRASAERLCPRDSSSLDHP